MNAPPTVALLAATISMGCAPLAWPPAAVVGHSAAGGRRVRPLRPHHHARFNEPRWTTWNLVRTLTSTAAFALLAWALVLHGRST